ncbi:MAG: nucleotide sugar dehydrogenase [Pseudomonadota bacterium]
MSLDISVFGLGYVGTVSAVSLARLGHCVIGVDIDEGKVDQITRAVSPVMEPGVTDLLRKARADDRLAATTDAEMAIASTDISLVCVGTPSQQNGELSTDQLSRVAGQIGFALRTRQGYHGVVIRSTTIPGTLERLTETIARTSEKTPGVDFGVASNPEFMREASSIEDFAHPPYTVVGTTDPRLAEMLAEMYADIPAPFYRVAPREAEMLKYACNAYHATKVTFANEIGAISKRLGIDGNKVMSMLVEDTKLNVSSAYLEPGFAFGGSCLPKDLRAITHEAKRLDVAVPMLSAVLRSNNLQIERLVSSVLAEGRRKIGVLGLSFKTGTDDLRESPIVLVVETLLGKGYDLAIYDANVNLSRLVGANKSYIDREVPHLSSLMRSSTDEVVDHAELLLIANRSPEFRDAIRALRPDQKVLDLVRISDPPHQLDERYEGICW